MKPIDPRVVKPITPRGARVLIALGIGVFVGTVVLVCLVPNWAPVLTGGGFLAFFWILTGTQQIRDSKVIGIEAGDIPFETDSPPS